MHKKRGGKSTTWYQIGVLQKPCNAKPKVIQKLCYALQKQSFCITFGLQNPWFCISK